MKRYYMVRDEDMPTIKEDLGTFHYIDLESHGPAGKKWNLFCLVDETYPPKKSWIPLPPLYDVRTTLSASAVPHEALADIGLTGEETCAEAIAKLGDIHPSMGF